MWFIQNFTDITQQKNHEEQIALQKERYSRVLGDLNSIVFDSNLEVQVNMKYLKTLAVSGVIWLKLLPQLRQLKISILCKRRLQRCLQEGI